MQAGQGRAHNPEGQGRAHWHAARQGRAEHQQAWHIVTAIKHECMWSHLKSSMSTVMRRSLSANPSSTVRPLGCSETLYASSVKFLTSSVDLQYTTH